jgi:hypothetical protein
VQLERQYGAAPSDSHAAGEKPHWIGHILKGLKNP